MEITIILLIIIAVPLLLVRAAIKKGKESNGDNYPERPHVDDAETGTVEDEDHLPHPGNGYVYYELVGMKHRNLTRKDYGVHTGYALAESSNQYDKYAVGIYRQDNGKLIAYIPREFQGKSNKKLHDVISALGGSTPARFRVWERNGNIYGCAYVKE